MTIRDHFQEIQKPYTRWTWGFALFLAFGPVGALFASARQSSESYDPIHYICIAGIPYLVGSVGLMATTLIPFFRTRCRKCRTAMRGRWKHWRLPT